MSSKRSTVLMAILLLLLGAYFAQPALEGLYYGGRNPAQAAAARPQGPLPAANGVSGLTVTREADGRWMASLEYAYTGTPAGAMLRVYQVVTSGPGATTRRDNWLVGGRSAVPGTHRFTTEVFNPNVHQMYITHGVFAQLDVAPAPPIAKVLVEQIIQWPDPLAVKVEQAIAGGKQEVLVQEAVVLIDTGNRDKLQEARTLLQALVDKSPRTEAAFVELARIAMKTNWNPDGLRDAEHLLGSALQVQPDNVNAKILLGYVYAHQARYKEAEALFAAAAAANAPNLWLWANWGELLAMQGRTEQAIQKYREAVARPPTKDTYDRARWDAYSHLLRLLESRKDLDGTEALLKQRAQEYLGDKCFAVEYAAFLVLQRADSGAALGVLRDMPSPACALDDTRAVQGLAHYVTWSQGKEPERAESLRQARAFMAVNTNLFYSLASSDRSTLVAQQLIALGEKVSVRDRSEMDALAYALRNGEGAVARRLLRLGANPLAQVGPEKLPAALIPVLTRDFDMIKLLQRAGVDYTKVRYQGTTAVEHARKQGDTKLQQLLDPRSGSL